MSKLLNAALLSLACTAFSSHAGVAGDTISAAYSVPAFNLNRDLGTHPIDSWGTLFSFPDGGANFLVSDNDIEITFNLTNGFSSNFNVFFNFKDLSKDFPANYRVAYSTFDFDDSRLTTTGNTLGILVSGIEFSPADRILLTMTPLAAVPEPEQLALLVSGLGVIGYVARRRRNSTTRKTPARPCAGHDAAMA